ncbi:MAG: VCBS repeat-containing protein, partial [Gemmatimonadales bacterium]
DVTARAGVGAPDRFSSGAALADLDGDGDLDLVLLATTGPNAVFENDGTGRFTERRDLGLDPAGKGGTTVAVADVDGDGDLDLYVANYKPFAPADSMPPQQLAFNQLVREVSPGRFEVRSPYDRDFSIHLSPDGRSGNLVQRAEPDDFYLNEGGRFVRVPLTDPRFTDASGRRLAQEPESFGLGARFADLNGDGAPDLYVANDFEGADELWLGDGRGHFRMADWTAQRQTSNSGMAVDIADVNADGLPDLYEVDMLSNDTRRLKTQMPTHTPVPKEPGEMESKTQLQRNTLFLNRGDGTFGEVSEFAGIEASGWSWSTMFLDVDLDGWQDILIGTGHTWDVMDADTQERLQNRLVDVPWRRVRWEYPALPLRNVAYRNRGDLTYEDVSAKWHFGVDEDISHAMAAADLDGDGDRDVVINRLGAPALLLRNDAAAPRLAIRLVGDAPNTRAIGAVIEVRGGPVPLQRTEIAAGGLYLSHSDYQATFAAGAADSLSVIVSWRDGRRSVFPGLRPGRVYEITTETAAAAPVADSAVAPTLFADATAELGGHTHAEPAFDDWERQLLLPNSLAQLGPGVSWFDLDRDGDEDLMVGSGRGGRLAVFWNDGGRLVAEPPRGAGLAADLTTVLGVAGPDGARLLAGVSNWEARSAEEARSIPGVLTGPAPRRGAATAAEVLAPPDAATTGPLAVADYDGDGDLDLFVGGRAVVAAYPLAGTSRLYRNDGGHYVLDQQAGPALRAIGLVSAAVFTDIDGDGDPDLVLAREWQPLLLLRNDGGRFTVPASPTGLEGMSSRWNGLAAGDLDGDGRMDLVATSWGRNVAFQADSARPLMLLYGPFGGRGELEMLLARQDPRLGALAPLNSYARVRIALPNLVSRVRTFAAYADASAEQVLGVPLDSVSRLEATTFDHVLLLNRGDRFEARPLPTEAQLAPAFGVAVADFDGDGREDVFLAQNFFPTAIGIPRYDTGRSLLLLGDGRGGVAAVPGGRSGLVVYGDQRAAAFADLDGDGRLDLAVGQNGGKTRLFRNRGARPGLRVRLVGPPGNPDGIGAMIRLRFADGGEGPAREVSAGSGYWSQNGAVQVMGAAAAPAAVVVRWPGGSLTETVVADGAREVVVRW